MGCHAPPAFRLSLSATGHRQCAMVWELLCPDTIFLRSGDGGDGLDAIRVVTRSGLRWRPAILAFRPRRFLTFHVPVDLPHGAGVGSDWWAGRSICRRIAISAPTIGGGRDGLGPVRLTMHWRSHDRGNASLSRPASRFVHVFPVQRAVLEAVTPQVMPLFGGPGSRAATVNGSGPQRLQPPISRTPTACPHRGAGRKPLSFAVRDAAGQRLGAQGGIGRGCGSSHFVRPQ